MVIEPEKPNDGLDVLFAADVIGHPARLGMNIVQIDTAGSDQFFPNSDRKRKVRHTVSMQMPDLPPADMKEYQPAAMPFDTHAGPGTDLALDLQGNRIGDHVLSVAADCTDNADLEFRARSAGLTFDAESWHHSAVVTPRPTRLQCWWWLL